jgi:hypothetical protein
MSLIWTPNQTFRVVEYSSEADLEAAIILVQKALFGENRIYLDVKKKIGNRGEKRNIPDGYLLDLSGSRAKLYVVENELARHDPIGHVAIQLLEFALAFEAAPRMVRDILLNAIQEQPNAKMRCEEYIASNTNYRNLDHLLDGVVHSEFAAVVIIDQVPDRLENVLATKLGFTVEVIELKRYADTFGNHTYSFTPFLEEFASPAHLTSTAPHVLPSRDIDEVDTLVVPAREDGFQETFLGENRWYAIRIGGVLRSRIKYIAVYRTAPVSAITHVAPVASIEPWEDSDKFVVNFAEPAREIPPVGRGNRLKHLQNTLSTNLQRLLSAKTLDDL